MCPKPSVKLIIRYENRKLWCPSERRYYTLRDLLSMVKNNEPFRVEAHSNHADITEELLRRALGKSLPSDMRSIQKLIRAVASLEKVRAKDAGEEVD